MFHIYKFNCILYSLTGFWVDPLMLFQRSLRKSYVSANMYTRYDAYDDITMLATKFHCLVLVNTYMYRISFHHNLYRRTLYDINFNNGCIATAYSLC